MGKECSLRSFYSKRKLLLSGVEVTSQKRKSQLWGTKVTVPVYSFEALVAKKLKTFYVRETGKDLYDIYRSLQGRKASEMRNNVGTLRKVLKVEGIKYTDFVSGMNRALQDDQLLARVHASSMANPSSTANSTLKL